MKSRTPGSIEDAIDIIYGLIGKPRAAEVVGKSVAHIYRWSDPDHESRPSINQALALEAECIRQTGHSPITDVWNRALEAAIEAAPKNIRRVEDSVMALAGAAGHVSDLTVRALADGKITPNEERELLKEVENTRRSTDAVESAVRQAAHHPNTSQERVRHGNTEPPAPNGNGSAVGVNDPLSHKHQGVNAGS